MDSRTFFEMVEQMRYWQKRWFDPKTRTQKALSESRRIEQAIDAEIKRVRSIIGEKKSPEEPELFENT